MCGICYIFKWLSYSQNQNISQCRIDIDQLNQNINSRGPDMTSTLQCNQNKISMYGSVLHFQGHYLQPQPIYEDNKEIQSSMLWNGEIFSGNIDHQSSNREGDTQIIFQKILDLEIYYYDQMKESILMVEICYKFINSARDMLELIGGPFSIIYYSSRFNITLFSRDPLGRRSLMMHLSSYYLEDCSPVDLHELSDNHVTNELIISSVSGKHQYEQKSSRTIFGRGDLESSDSDPYTENDKESCWKEIPVDGVYVIFNNFGVTLMENIKCVAPWKNRHTNHPLLISHPDIFPLSHYIAITTDIAKLTYGATLFFLQKSWNISSGQYYKIATTISNTIEYFNYSWQSQIDTPNIHLVAYYLGALTASVYRRVNLSLRCGDQKNQPIMILFSGGIDSTILVALTHIVLSSCDEDLNIPFELVNIASGGNPSSAPDRLASIKAYQELQRLPKFQQRDCRLIFVDIIQEELSQYEEHIKQIIYPRETVMDFNIGTALWFGVRGIGKLVDPKLFDQNREKLDMILSRSQLRFGNKKTSNATNSFDIQPSDFDDLIKAIMNEMITQEKYNDDLSPILLSTLRGDKLKSEMDKHNCTSLIDLIKLAQKEKLVKIVRSTDERPSSKCIMLTREQDIIQAKEEISKYQEILKQLSGEFSSDNKYKSQSRVVILGMGADESLGGYSRYKTKPSLQDELQLDFRRLWERNLGRDDRVTADHGREGRFPFLDEDVLSVLSGNHVPVQMTDVFDLSCPSGIGEKMLLRTCARMIGLQDISFLVKRAIQFGTRIADKNISGETLFN